MPSERLPLYLSSSRLRLLLCSRSLDVERRALAWPNLSLSPDLTKQRCYIVKTTVSFKHIPFANNNDWCKVKIPKLSVTDLRLKEDPLRLLGEGRDCRHGERDLRLSGEWLTLRLAGLVSYNLPVPSTRERFLKEAEIFHHSEKASTIYSIILLH